MAAHSLYTQITAVLSAEQAPLFSYLIIHSPLSAFASPPSHLSIVSSTFPTVNESKVLALSSPRLV